MIKRIQKIKFLFTWLLFVLLGGSCATHPYSIMTVDIRNRCLPYAEYETVIPNSENNIILLSHYKNCFQYKDLLVFGWKKRNITSTRLAVRQLLYRYLKMENMTAQLVQWEQWDNAFYVLYELEKR